MSTSILSKNGDKWKHFLWVDLSQPHNMVIKILCTLKYYIMLIWELPNCFYYHRHMFNIMKVFPTMCSNSPNYGSHVWKHNKVGFAAWNDEKLITSKNKFNIILYLTKNFECLFFFLKFSMSSVQTDLMTCSWNHGNKSFTVIKFEVYLGIQNNYSTKC